MRPRSLAFGALVVVGTLGVAAPPAHAALDPERAEADVRALLEESEYGFCSKPDDPLSPAARQMCPLAGEVPGCTALVEACAKKEEPFELGAFWQGVLRFLGRAAPFVAWALIAAILGLVAYLVFRAIRAAKEEALPVTDELAPDVTLLPDAPLPQDLTPAEALLRRAAEAQARGDARTALFVYLAAALRALDDRGAIRVARDRTNGEYVRSCQEAAARPGLRDLVREVDQVQFGGKDATLDMAALAERRAERIVRATGLAPLAMLALGSVLALGACKALDGLSRDDPAGRGLLVELLQKQGMTLTRVPGSLAHLPMNGTHGAVVMLDAERVPLEDDTRAHVVEWVRQGGALVLTGDPARWPSEFWAKRQAPTGDPTSTPETGPEKVVVETRDRPPVMDDDDDDDEDAPVQSSAAHVHHATLARRAAMTWPNEDRSPRAIAKLTDGELYGALRSFGRGKVLGLASGDLLTNLALAVPGNAASVIALLGALDRHEFAVARAEQGVTPPENPLAGLLKVGLGPALVHAVIFVPLLFFAFGVRQSAPRPEPPPRRRAFAEHVRAVGGIYARRRAASHALAVYAKYVDDRVRAAMGRGGDPVDFLATRSGAPREGAVEAYALAAAARAGEKPRGDELAVLQRLAAMFAKAGDKG